MRRMENYQIPEVVFAAEEEEEVEVRLLTRGGTERGVAFGLLFSLGFYTKQGNKKRGETKREGERGVREMNRENERWRG